jgi:alanyl-tRNA synthetase
MNTTLLYLADTYRDTATATILATGADERGWYVQTNQTVFYPQGGGQPADRGVFRVNGTEISITFTGFRDGIVYHYTSFDLGPHQLVGQTAEQAIDLPQRLANSRLHAAGHLIAHVLETLDPALVPSKGHHFSDGAYIELANPAELPVADWLARVNMELALAIAANLPITATLVDYDTVARVRPSLAPFTPKDKPSRIVQIGDYRPLPCGGTHPASLAALGAVRVTKAKTKQGTTKVSYEIRESA